jgi:pyridoxal phosphate enzyme (YggS family)
MSVRSRAMVLENLAEVRRGIDAACARVGRDPGSVRLVAAGKTVEVQALKWVHGEGVRDFGENYVQELRSKREELPEATWHFIGTLQSHTAHRVAELADIVETLVPGRALTRLSRRAVERGRTIPVLLEVDLTEGRTGVVPDELAAACEEVQEAEGLELVGLMTLPPLTETAEAARPYFVRLRELLDRVRREAPDAVELSMGMSLDYEVAVEEGATMVRIGTALFGERPPAR